MAIDWMAPARRAITKAAPMWNAISSGLGTSVPDPAPVSANLNTMTKPTDYFGRLQPAASGVASDFMSGAAYQPYAGSMNEANARSARNARAGFAQQSQALGIGQQGAGMQGAQGLESSIAQNTSANLLQQAKQEQAMRQSGVELATQIGDQGIAKTASDVVVAGANQGNTLDMMDYLIKFGGEENLASASQLAAGLGVDGVNMSRVGAQQVSQDLGMYSKQLGAAIGQYGADSWQAKSIAGEMYDANPDPSMSRDDAIAATIGNASTRQNELTATLGQLDDALTAKKITPEEHARLSALVKSGTFDKMQITWVDGKPVVTDRLGNTADTFFSTTATTLADRFARSGNPVKVTDGMLSAYIQSQLPPGTDIGTMSETELAKYAPPNSMDSAQWEAWTDANYADPSRVGAFVNGSADAPAWEDMNSAEREAVAGTDKAYVVGKEATNIFEVGENPTGVKQNAYGQAGHVVPKLPQATKDWVGKNNEGTMVIDNKVYSVSPQNPIVKLGRISGVDSAESEVYSAEWVKMYDQSGDIFYMGVSTDGTPVVRDESWMTASDWFIR